jgi:hypothetical protein
MTTLTEPESLIIESSVWFLDEWHKAGRYPTLENYADFIYAVIDGAELSVTGEEIKYCASLLNQKYPDFASADEIGVALTDRLADKISAPQIYSIGKIFTILGVTLFIGYLIQKKVI